MKNLISFLIIGLFLFSSSYASAQSTSKIQMTPAEYQSLMETILTAKKKRMAKRKRYYQYNQRIAMQKAEANNNDQTASKIQELEKVYQQITQQQQTDRNNAELQQVKSKLEQEMRQLEMQLEQEKSEKENINTQYRDQIATRDADLKTSDQPQQSELLTLRNQQNALRLELEKSNQNLNDLQQKRDDYEKEMQQNEIEMATLKQQVKQLESNEKEIDELQTQIRTLEKQQRTLVVLSQTSKQKPGTPVDTSAKMDAAYLMAFSKDIAELELKVERLEAESKASTDNSSNHTQLKALEDRIIAINSGQTAPDYSKEFTALQNKLSAIEQELKAHKHDSGKPAPIIINTPPPAPAPVVVPVPAPAPKEDIKSFVTSRRQQNVYFANGSTQLNPTEQNKVREIANWLSTYELLDITIRGYASNVGSIEVNQRISQQRAATVKQTLLNLGVQSQRIILEPLGIDNASTDPANARRAEIHLLIRE